MELTLVLSSDGTVRVVTGTSTISEGREASLLLAACSPALQLLADSIRQFYSDASKQKEDHQCR